MTTLALGNGMENTSAPRRSGDVHEPEVAFHRRAGKVAVLPDATIVACRASNHCAERPDEIHGVA